MKTIEIVDDINKEYKRSYVRLMSLNKRLKKDSNHKFGKLKLKP
jgi:hypothetical protein